jgi:hypothetical protein
MADDTQEPVVDAPDGLPDDATIARAEAKPPLYRFFRGALYVGYMVVVVWFCLSMIIGVYRAFMG